MKKEFIRYVVSAFSLAARNDFTFYCAKYSMTFKKFVNDESFDLLEFEYINLYMPIKKAI